MIEKSTPPDSLPRKVLIIGSGPIIIGQACEFDYSGTQACKALREEGIQVVLVNSNPATIMTDPEMSDRTYIEPITGEAVAKVIALEKPDAILPTLGGQTALNVAIELSEAGVLEEHGIRLIGATEEVIRRAEDREAFRKAMQEIGLDIPRSATVRGRHAATLVRDALGLPLVIRPAFTLGGTGGGIAYNRDEFDDAVGRGLDASPIGEILIEESVLGWKEFELEVMRDRLDHVVVICSIENVDPMGVHTGDSITVAPTQTLTDKEFQRMRDAAAAVIRKIGVETGGANIQFAVEPETGRMVVIEMNPRVSRSSALASKATGFPIAKIAAKLAIGHTLDEIPNDITRETPAVFEPAIDYCVVKIPRFTFEKFPEADPTLTIQMKSVGEVMAIGRTFKEALQKAVRSLETGKVGLCSRGNGTLPGAKELRSRLAVPTADRLFQVVDAMRAGISIPEIHQITAIDPWFLSQIGEIVEMDSRLGKAGELSKVPGETLREAKRMGFTDGDLGRILGVGEEALREALGTNGAQPAYKLVDTCAAEFEAYTPYYYSTSGEEDEARTGGKKKVLILGSGPNRIGQGIEFDYCCVQAAFALREEGFETIMVNSNPETVSTDYDTSDLLFFEPLTLEDVLNIYRRLEPEGTIVQLGGQTPLNIARGLEAAGARILGTSPNSIDIAEDRERCTKLLGDLDLLQPPFGLATDFESSRKIASRVGYPVMVRPSYVLGGRAMEIVYDEGSLEKYLTHAVEASPEHPVLIDRFLEEAIEVDVDAIADGEKVIIGGILEHIEEAGIHSGDSSCTLPAYTLSDSILDRIREMTVAIAMALEVKGLVNIQFAVKSPTIYVLEVNPRASRTVPFVSKATGVPLARLAAKVMVGRRLDDLGLTREPEVAHISVKKSVFPYGSFPGVDIIGGPEMRSTGEVMGIADDFGTAFAKAQMSASLPLPLSGKVFLSVKDSDKREIIDIAKRLRSLGFEILATRGTHKVLVRNGVTQAQLVKKIDEGRPNVLDIIRNHDVGLVINTPSGKEPRTDEARIRAFTVPNGIPCITTLSAAQAALGGIEALRQSQWGVRPLQDYYRAGDPGDGSGSVLQEETASGGELG